MVQKSVSLHHIHIYNINVFRRAKFRQQKRQREILQQTAARRASLTMGILADPSTINHHHAQQMHHQNHGENAPGSTETNTNTTSPARSSSPNCVDPSALLDPSGALMLKTEPNDLMSKAENHASLADEAFRSNFFFNPTNIASTDPMATHWFSPNNPASTSKSFFNITNMHEEIKRHRVRVKFGILLEETDFVAKMLIKN
jgi:hypothetical protein